MRGVVPLTGRQEPWMESVLADHSLLDDLVEQHGSPVNLIDPSPLPHTADALVAAARRHEVELRIFVARKANKALAVVDAALAAGHGVDVASLGELQQVVARLDRHDAVPEQVILSAAVKPRALLEEAARTGVLVSIDNLDELALLTEVADPDGPPVPVALRLRPELPDVPVSRFGMGADQVARLLATPGLWDRLRLAGLHFHLDGYAASHRRAVLLDSLEVVDLARSLGHSPEFVDIGGGVPMRYLDESAGWEEFWRRHRDGDPMTWHKRSLGTVYPAWQEPVGADWLDEVLADGVAEQVRARDLRLHLEPGRSMLDGCGLTVARVEFRKQQPDGTWLVGLAMNRTQCRSTADDFLVDPVLVPAPDAARTPSGEGYLVGAYCIEAELLTWRRMVLPHGVAVGDLVAFVNTAGYLMHIVESGSHQIPLARNLVPDGTGWRLDDIDAD